MATLADPRLEDPKKLTELLRDIGQAYLANEHFRYFLLKTMPEVAETFGAKNLQIVFPTGSEILLRGGLTAYARRPDRLLWDAVRLARDAATWALYEPATEDKESCAGYGRLEKPGSRLLHLVIDSMQIPPGSLQHVQTPRSGQVNLENSVVLARLELVSPNVSAINRVVEQYNRLQPDLWHTH